MVVGTTHHMTRNHTDSQALSAELVALLRLTRAEAQIARVRVSQARDEAVRRELEDNAEEADGRAARIQDALRRLGGTPDVVGDAVGRVIALTKAATEQVQPFSDGLLGDLALEHQLRDRVIFTRVLAEAGDEPWLVALMDQLERAHTETIEWIRVRLAEVAQGGPVALKPTPPQAVISALTWIATLPTRQSAELVNKAADAVRRSRAKAADTADATMRRVRETAEATGEVVDAGRDAALARAEEVAPASGVRQAAREARENLGTVDADVLPIEAYDAMSSADAVRSVHELDSSDDVRLVLRYEQAHKNRKRVGDAAEKRLTALAEESVTA